MSDNTSTKKRLELKPLEVGVGAVAAVVTAFASSYLGTAGTLAGAALASVIGTVSTALLRTSAERTTESLLRTRARLRQPVTGPEMGGGSTRVDPGIAAMEEPSVAAAVESTGTDPAAGPPGAGQVGPLGPAKLSSRMGRTSRPRLAVLAAGAVLAFVAALVAITGIESMVGKPLAALIGRDEGGGTTVGRTVGGDPAPAREETDTPAPTPTADESPTSSPSPSPDASPTDEPSPSPDPTETAAPTPEPSVSAPAPQPTVGPSP